MQELSAILSIGIILAFIVLLATAMNAAMKKANQPITEEPKIKTQEQEYNDRIREHLENAYQEIIAAKYLYQQTQNSWRHTHELNLMHLTDDIAGMLNRHNAEMGFGTYNKTTDPESLDLTVPERQSFYNRPGHEPIQ